jgi:hypothetical protein
LIPLKIGGGQIHNARRKFISAGANCCRIDLASGVLSLGRSLAFIAHKKPALGGSLF